MKLEKLHQNFTYFISTAPSVFVLHYDDFHLEFCMLQGTVLAAGANAFCDFGYAHHGELRCPEDPANFS